MSPVGARELGTARFGETHAVWILGEVGRSGVSAVLRPTCSVAVAGMATVLDVTMSDWPHRSDGFGFGRKHPHGGMTVHWILGFAADR